MVAREGGDKHMSAEENKAIARREMEELFNHTGNLDVADEIYAPDYVGPAATPPAGGPGAAAAPRFDAAPPGAADKTNGPDDGGHEATQPEGVHGVEGARQFAVAIRSAFPDLTCTVEDQVAEGDKVGTRWPRSDE